MVRIIIKGGVWRNTEDEILKAAISKYGKNQWARISSLLVRKTPKQCKARWFEWLDPSIKKVEWSKTEDEKLLHLAKLMPTQWRTIAPIVGRTATQCLERYQKLLDEAEAREASDFGLGGPEGPDGAPAVDDTRRLKTGEVDVDQETKAARPDPVDMDEDEKEMLSEARARLANTQGKKAKRKARERQLEEARRLAALQKKRELKAAGIILRHKPKNAGMDYNADIPFNKQPVPGFYDVSDENAKKQTTPIGQSLRQLEGKRRIELEEMQDKKKKQKNNKGGSQENSQFIAAREAQIQKLKETDQIIKRRKLNLPTPQVGEAELEDIVKIGRSSRSARDLVGGEGAAGELIGDYDALSRAKTAKTPRTAPQEDNIMAEALNLRNMTAAQTPLLGDENTPMHGPTDYGTGFESATPRHHVTATPNPLATPMRAGQDFGATPRTTAGSTYSETPMRTPMRDSLSINADGDSSYGDTPRDIRLREQQAKRTLRAGFASLPTPENNFEFDEPEMEEEDEVEEPILTEEDAAERDARMEKMRLEEEARSLARRSTVVKKDLPRPLSVNLQRLIDQLSEVSQSRSPEQAEADQLVDYELAQLMLHDAIAHPLPGSSVPAGTISQYEIPEDDAIESARAEIHKELATSLGFPGATDVQLRRQIDTMAIEDEAFMVGGWIAERQQLIFDHDSGTWLDKSTISEPGQSSSYSGSVSRLLEKMVTESSKAIKTEKKLAKQLGGYQMIHGKLNERIVVACNSLREQKRDFDTFSILRVAEQAAGPKRVADKREEIAQLEKRERDLQDRYADMAAQRRSLMESIEKMEEEKMVNEAQDALDAMEAAQDAAMDETE